MNRDEIKVWCEDNLFGTRTVPGVGFKIPLTDTQKAVQLLAVEVIAKWEERDRGDEPSK